MSKENKNIPLKNDDIVMDFDPMYLGNHTFLDHSSQENFDQQFWFQWYIGCHCLEENILQSKNADVSTHVTVQSASIKKIVSFDIIMKFWKIHSYHKLKYQCDRFSVGLNFRPLDSSDTSEAKGFLFGNLLQFYSQSYLLILLLYLKLYCFIPKLSSFSQFGRLSVLLSLSY